MGLNDQGIVLEFRAGERNGFFLQNVCTNSVNHSASCSVFTGWEGEGGTLPWVKMKISSFLSIVAQ